MRVIPSADGTCPSCRGTFVAAVTQQSTPAVASPGETDPSRQPTPKIVVEANSISGKVKKRGLGWILFSFEGRIPRRVYWAALLGTVATCGIAVFLFLGLLGGLDFIVTNLGLLVLCSLAVWILLAV